MRRAVAIEGAFLFAVALALRLAGWRYGLGWVHEPDAESVGLARALARGAPISHLLDPSRYPHLLVYPIAAVLALVPQAPALLVGRALSALLGALCALFTWMLGRRLFGPAAGRIAGLAVALSAFAVQQSHLVKPHAALAAAAAACGLLAAGHVVRPSRRRFAALLAVAALGFAAFQAGLLLFMMPAAAWLLARPRAPSLRFALGAGALALLAALVVGHPNRLMDLGRIALGRADLDALFFPHPPEMRESLGPSAYFRVGLFALEIAPLLAPLGAAALLALCLRRAPQTRPLLPFLVYALLHLLLFGTIRTFRPRFLLPLLPLLALGGAAALLTLSGGGPGRRPLRRAAAVLLVAALLLPQGLAALRYDLLLLRPDTRELAAEWLDRRVPPDVPIAAAHVVDFPWKLDPRSLREHLAVLGNLPIEEQRDLRAIAAGRPPREGPRRVVRFPFRDRWNLPLEARRRWIRQRGVRFGVTALSSASVERDPDAHPFPALGVRAARFEPGSPGFYGARHYLFPFLIVNVWRARRLGPVVEITRFEQQESPR